MLVTEMGLTQVTPQESAVVLQDNFVFCVNSTHKRFYLFTLIVEVYRSIVVLLCIVIKIIGQ